MRLDVRQIDIDEHPQSFSIVHIERLQCRHIAGWSGRDVFAAVIQALHEKLGVYRQIVKRAPFHFDQWKICEHTAIALPVKSLNIQGIMHSRLRGDTREVSRVITHFAVDADARLYGAGLS